MQSNSETSQKKQKKQTIYFSSEKNTLSHTQENVWPIAFKFRLSRIRGHYACGGNA